MVSTGLRDRVRMYNIFPKCDSRTNFFYFQFTLASFPSISPIVWPIISLPRRLLALQPLAGNILIRIIEIYMYKNNEFCGVLSDSWIRSVSVSSRNPSPSPQPWLGLQRTLQSPRGSEKGDISLKIELLCPSIIIIRTGVSRL